MDERRIKETALAMLEGGRAVLSIPGAWGTSVYATDSAGFVVDVEDEAGCCFCAMGALLAISRRSKRKGAVGAAAFARAYRLLNEEATGGNMVAMNDASTCVAPVLSAYDRAISRLKQELAG